MATLPPPPLQSPSGSFVWLDWYSRLTQYLNQSGSVPWNVINFSGSNITSIATRNHNDLQSMQGGTSGEYYHLTNAQWSSLPGGSPIPANEVLAGPTSGSSATPTFRALVNADLPANPTFTSLTLGSTSLLSTNVTLTDHSGASTGTLTNAPTAGNPTKWIALNDNGVTRYIPAW